MSSSSTLGRGVAVLAEALDHSRRRSRTPVPWARESVSDKHQQRPGQYACKDSTGRRRKRHEYLVFTRKGWRCLWCGRRALTERVVDR